jgi:hypothetical protein
LINGKKDLDEVAIDLTVNTAKSTAVSYACNYVDEAASLVQGQSSQYLGLGLGVGMTLINVCNAKTP